MPTDVIVWKNSNFLFYLIPIYSSVNTYKCEILEDQSECKHRSEETMETESGLLPSLQVSI